MDNVVEKITRKEVDEDELLSDFMEIISDHLDASELKDALEEKGYEDIDLSLSQDDDDNKRIIVDMGGKQIYLTGRS